MNNWHDAHQESLTTGDRIADAVAAFIGSWRFIILQSLIMAVWVVGNAVILIFHLDPYPFVFLNLFMSAEAAFSTPLILMSQNRGAERDRHNAEADYRVNQDAERRIENLQLDLSRIENENLDKILAKIS